MILAIQLHMSDVIDDNDFETVTGKVIYADEIATFEYERDAERFAKGENDMILIDCESMKIIRNCQLVIKQEEE